MFKDNLIEQPKKIKASMEGGTGALIPPLFSQGQSEKMSPAMAGIGSRVMLAFKSPALKNYRAVQVGSGAGVYGTVTYNEGSDSESNFPPADEDKFQQHLKDYFPDSIADWIHTVSDEKLKIIKEGEPILIDATSRGQIGQTTTTAGRTQVMEGFYPDSSQDVRGSILSF